MQVAPYSDSLSLTSLPRKPRQDILYLDTDNRDSGTSLSAPVWTVNGNYQKIVAVWVATASIPVTWYTFTSLNNTFSVTHSTAGTYTVTIPVGTYTYTSFVTALATALASGGITYTVTISVINGLMTVTASAGTFTFNFTGAVLDPVQCPAYAMGFNTASVASVSTVLTSQQFVNMQPFNKLFLQSNFQLNTGRYVSQLPNILQDIIVDQGYAGNIAFGQNSNKSNIPYINYNHGSTWNMNQIQLALLYPDGLPVDLNGQKWAISLVIQSEPQ